MTQLEDISPTTLALDTSPLERDPEQPPCDSRCEGICLTGMFAVPARMQRFDLSPHLVFAEHRAIWRSMKRAARDYPAVGLWLSTFTDLIRERPVAAAADLMVVLDFSPLWTVNDSNEGSLLFMLAFNQLVRCADARRRIHAAQEAVTRDWRVPATPYSLDEKRRMLRRYDLTEVGMDIPV